MPTLQTTFCVLSADDPDQRAEWTGRWESWPGREVFAHPGYVRLFAGEGRRPCCACWEGDEGNVLYPFLVRDLTREPYCAEDLGPAVDLVTPYGYGGPFCWDAPSRDRLAEAFWPAFSAWAADAGVVSEFVRLTLFPETALPYPGPVQTDRNNVVRDLEPDEPVLWMDFKHKVRKNVKKAQRSGVAVEVDPAGRRRDDFLRIYEATMERRGADEGYYFGDGFFERLGRDVPGGSVYFHALHQGRVVSTELVLVSARSVYSFLGGTDEAAFDLRPNDLLKYEIMRRARREGKRRFVLGGGYQPDDGIYRYKTAFAPGGVVPFRTGRRVLRPDAYDTLCRAREMHAACDGQPWQPRPAFFPAYRA
jgi:hypothetical protein